MQCADLSAEGFHAVHQDHGNRIAVPGIGPEYDRKGCFDRDRRLREWWCGRRAGCRNRVGWIALVICCAGEGRRIGHECRIGIGGRAGAQHVGDAGQRGHRQLRIVTLTFGPAVAVAPATRDCLGADFGPGPVQRSGRRIRDSDQVGRAIMFGEAVLRMGETTYEEVGLPGQEGQRIRIAKARGGDGCRGEVILLPGRQGAAGAIDAWNPAMRFTLLGRPARDLRHKPGPVRRRSFGEGGLLGASVGAGPGRVVNLPQAPGGTPHLVFLHHQILRTAPDCRPLAHQVPTGLGLDVVEHPALPGQQVGHIG